MYFYQHFEAAHQKQLMETAKCNKNVLLWNFGRLPDSHSLINSHIPLKTAMAADVASSSLRFIGGWFCNLSFFYHLLQQ